MFQVLVHASLYASLRRLPGERRDRFRRLVDRLRAGRWDGGARVKKLQGVGKPVFEARPDDRDRILFTLSRSASPDRADWLETYLQIWDLVHHDRVEGRAARLNLSAEAEFLDYREVESESITEPPPHPTASFGEVPPATPGGRAGVVDLMLPPDDWRPAEREEVAGCVRWYLVPDRWLTRDEDWQALMDGGAEELELKLTAEQYAVVRAPGPVLLSGSAGSGKTTIAVHRLAAAASGPDAGRTLYLTYSPWLLDYARRLFRDLLLCRGGPTRGGVEFLTVDDLYRALVACRGGKAPAGTAGFGEFSAWHRRAVGEGDAALAWEEIRSIVKGACLDPGRAMLHRGEYEALGRKRAPLFESRREGLYRVARRWQKHLEETGRLDEIDLCRMALAQVGPGDAYDHIVCDEAQDLAEIQVDLLLRLQRGRNLQGLFLAGDPQQVINPSGFRWAEVRTAIRRRFLDSGRPTPALHALTRNFRSVRGLVDLANEVLALKRERTGRSDGDEAEESMVAGAAPIRVVGKEADLIRAAAGFGPRCAVVAGSGAVRDRLVRELDTTRIFLVPEVKGLEFDVVILWGFLAANPDPWRRLLDPALDLREDPQCRRALHHLYVAVTRARRHLAVYEPDDAPWFWTSARFRGKIDPESPDLLGRLFARSADPADWLREGEYFLVRGRHRQAAECFRRGNDPSREAECLALHHESAGEPGEAAGMWLSLGRWNRTAQCLETAGRFQEAARLWSQAGDSAAAERCRIRSAEAEGRWREAGEHWEKREAWEDAARCWNRAGEAARGNECLAWSRQAEGNWAEAARLWKGAGNPERAAAAWRQAGREQEALREEAGLQESKQRWEEAAVIWERLGEERRAIRCRATRAESDGDWAVAAREWERMEEFTAAANAWRKADAPAEVRRCAIKIDLAAGRYARAAEAAEEIADFREAAAAWRQALAAGQRPRRPLPLPLPEDARNPWAPGCPRARLAGRDSRPGTRMDPLSRALVCEVRAAEDAGDYGTAERLWTDLRDRGQALRCRVASLRNQGRGADAAALLEERGKLEAARSAWMEAGQPDRAARCEAVYLEKTKRFQKAADVWERLGEAASAARCRGRHFLRRGDFDAAEGFLAEAGVEGKALQRVVRAIQCIRRKDFDQAERLLTEAGEEGKLALRMLRTARAAAARRLPARGPSGRKRPSLRRAYELAEWGRTLPASATVGAGWSPVGHRPKRRQGSRTPGAGHGSLPLFPETGTSPSRREARRRTSPAAWGSPETEGALPLQERILARVARVPGLTCMELAEMTDLPVAGIKPVLRDLVRKGRLRKTGLTRGTRYWLPGSVPKTGDPDGV